MPIPDEERFEAYLKQFRPLVPEPIPTSGSRDRARGGFVLLWVGAASGVALLVGAAALHIHTQRVRFAQTTSSPATTDPLTDRQPLTMRSANALIEKSPSFKVLVDGMAFRSQTIPVPKGKLSAVSVLAKEKIKL